MLTGVIPRSPGVPGADAQSNSLQNQRCGQGLGNDHYHGSQSATGRGSQQARPRCRLLLNLVRILSGNEPAQDIAGLSQGARRDIPAIMLIDPTGRLVRVLGPDEKDIAGAIRNVHGSRSKSSTGK
jgi:hypothetical protein